MAVLTQISLIHWIVSPSQKRLGLLLFSLLHSSGSHSCGDRSGPRGPFSRICARPHQQQAADSIGVGILASSTGLKEWLFQSTMKIARKTDSSVLKANAWHHRVDALTAVVALVGLSGRVFDGWISET